MRSVCFVTMLIEEERILDKTIKRMLIHSIEADDVMQAMSGEEVERWLGPVQQTYERRP